MEEGIEVEVGVWVAGKPYSSQTRIFNYIGISFLFTYQEDSNDNLNDNNNVVIIVSAVAAFVLLCVIVVTAIFVVRWRKRYGLKSLEKPDFEPLIFGRWNKKMFNLTSQETEGLEELEKVLYSK